MSHTEKEETLVFIIPDEFLGQRFDRVVAELCPQFSRSQLQKWIKSGDIRINDKQANVRDKIIGGEEVTVTPLVNQLQEREVKREYLALVCKEVIAGDTIEGNIGRHPQDRKKMTVLTNGGGKTAITHFRVEQKLLHHTLLRVNLETGRTHQIRVHLAWKHMPILGDRVYGGRSRVPANIDGELREQLQKMNRQCLHATRLTIVHPHTSEEMSWQVDMPKDMQILDTITPNTCLVVIDSLKNTPEITSIKIGINELSKVALVARLNWQVLVNWLMQKMTNYALNVPPMQRQRFGYLVPEGLASIDCGIL
ncbi:Ribosomal large subunit pseudouridine synthase D [Nymphon striatum]|nr:Ribosomal large subunit pseudouridine synthase D [Nymphon striatum]